MQKEQKNNSILHWNDSYATKKVMDYADSESNGPQWKDDGFTQWVNNGSYYMPVPSTVAALPPGRYIPVYRHGMYQIQSVPTRTDDLVMIKDPVHDEVMTDIRKFWASEAKYREHGFPLKRGILLFGRHGNGKTSLIRMLQNELESKHKGILIEMETPDSIYGIEQVLRQLQQVEKNRKIIIVIEDVDNFMSYGGGVTAKLLQLLDGNIPIDGVVFLATTNHPERLLESLTDRPSRFDRRYEILSPNAEARQAYIEAKFPRLPKETVLKIVQATEGFTLDHLKEVVLSTYVLGYPLEQVIRTMHGMFELKTNDSMSEGEKHLQTGNTVVVKKTGRPETTVTRKK